MLYKQILRILLLGAMSMLLLACDSGKEEAKGVIPEHQLKALEKAKDVEDQLKDADLQRRKQVDDE